METSKLSNDSLFRKKEKAILQYISMINDQKFFDQMKGPPQDRERPLLRAFGGANQKNHYDSRYGKSKSVSLQDDGMFEDRAVSEDFGNDSNYGENDTPGKKFGDTINEVPHNDPKGRDEFHFKSRTIYSQASETKPERSKGPSRPILKEIDFTPKGPDETRSEALPKNKTSSGLLPSISKPTVTAVAMNPKTMEKIQDFGFQGRPSVTTKEDFHVEPKGGEQTAEVRVLREKPKSDKKSHVEASKPTIRDFIVETRQIDVKDSSGQIEKERFQDKPKSDKLISKEASKPTIKEFKIEPRNIEAKESTGLIDLDRMEAASIPATAPRPTSALQAEGKTSYMSVKRNPKPQLAAAISGFSPSLDEIGSSISKYEQPMPPKPLARRSVEQKHSRGESRDALPSISASPLQTKKPDPAANKPPKLELTPMDIQLASMNSVVSGKNSLKDKDQRWTRQLSALGQEDGDWSRGVKYTTTQDDANSGRPIRDATPVDRSFERMGVVTPNNLGVGLGSKSSRADPQEETAHWKNSSARAGESSKHFATKQAPRPEFTDFGTSAPRVNIDSRPAVNKQKPVDFYTAEELARARNQIKASIENMFDMKQDLATDGELAQLIARFYHLMMDERNHLGKDKLERVLDLVSFYQSYVKKLKGEVELRQEEIKSKQALVDLQREKSAELEKAVRTMGVQVREAHEDRVELGRKLRAMELANKENDMRVKQVEQRYHENITKFKDMLRVVNEEVAFTRQSEMKAYEKVNALKHEYDKIYNENITLKTQVTNLDYKTKENQFEVDRLIEEVRGQANRNDGLLRERDMLAARIRDYQMRMADLEGAKIEIENQRAKSYELQRNLDSLRSELRNRDLQLMEMEHKVKYNENVKNLLLEENTRIIDNRAKESAKWRSQIDDMQDKGNFTAGEYYADRLNTSGTTLKKAANNALNPNPSGVSSMGKLFFTKTLVGTAGCPSEVWLGV